MKKILLIASLIFSFSNVFAQTAAQKIYDTEKAFEKAVAERGINQAFIEFSAPDGICLFPGSPVNCLEFFKEQKPSPAALLWNPTLIDISSNGALGYSTGNSVYRANGKDDQQAFYGEYATVWMRQPDGGYRAVLDLGISHAEANAETKWTTPADSGKEMNEKKSSAADASLVFFETAGRDGLAKAYKSFLAEDARLLREGKMPVVGKDAALALYKQDRANFFATKRSVFVGAADMAYISNTYLKADAGGRNAENGYFLQVWKLRNGKWQIVLDVQTPTAPEKK